MKREGKYEHILETKFLQPFTAFQLLITGGVVPGTDELIGVVPPAN